MLLQCMKLKPRFYEAEKNTLCQQHHKEEETACCVELLGSLSWIGNVAGSVWAHSWGGGAGGARTYCKPDPVNTAAGQSRDSRRIWYREQITGPQMSPGHTEIDGKVWG